MAQPLAGDAEGRLDRFLFCHVQRNRLNLGTMAPRKGCCMNLEDWHAATHDRQVGSESRQRVCDCGTYTAAAAGHYGMTAGERRFCKCGYGVCGSHTFYQLIQF